MNDIRFTEWELRVLRVAVELFMRRLGKQPEYDTSGVTLLQARLNAELAEPVAEGRSDPARYSTDFPIA
jgi:hypothetical protein